jgi:PAS domain S-box-containing protein
VDGVLWEADPATFRFTFVSDGVERLLGYPAARWLDEPGFWKNHLHPKDRDWVVEFCVTATRELRNHTFDYRMISDRDEVVWLRDLVTVEARDGKAFKLRGLMVDVTATRQEMRDLSRSKALFEAVFSHMPDALFVADENRCFVAGNPAVTRILGYECTQLIGKSAELLYSDKEDYHRLGRELFSPDAEVRFEPIQARLAHRDGSEFPGEIFGITLRDESGEVIGYLGIINDISDRVRAEEELRLGEERFRHFAEATSDWFWETAPIR